MELSDQQLHVMAEALTDLKASLEALLDSTEAGSKPVKLKDNQGCLSRMDEMHNQSILLANRNLTRNRLVKVAAAQRRLEEGWYGECTECAETIAFSRLEAYPEADLCISCQSQAEES